MGECMNLEEKQQQLNQVFEEIANKIAVSHYLIPKLESR
jgi:hypothetical protein